MDDDELRHSRGRRGVGRFEWDELLTRSALSFCFSRYRRGLTVDCRGTRLIRARRCAPPRLRLESSSSRPRRSPFSLHVVQSKLLQRSSSLVTSQPYSNSLQWISSQVVTRPHWQSLQLTLVSYNRLRNRSVSSILTQSRVLQSLTPTPTDRRVQGSLQPLRQGSAPSPLLRPPLTPLLPSSLHSTSPHTSSSTPRRRWNDHDSRARNSHAFPGPEPDRGGTAGHDQRGGRGRERPDRLPRVPQYVVPTLHPRSLREGASRQLGYSWS